MKTLPHKLLMLCPYLYAAGLAVSFLLDRFLPTKNSDWLVFLIMFTFLLLPAPLCILHAIFAFRQTNPAVLTKQNLMWKLSCTPVSVTAVAILVSTVISTNRAAADGATEGGLGVFLWFLLLLPVFLCCFAQLITTTVICAKLKEADSRISWYHIPLHMIPIADLISSNLVCRKFHE